jgi:hypothetical protein
VGKLWSVPVAWVNQTKHGAITRGSRKTSSVEGPKWVDSVSSALRAADI